MADVEKELRKCVDSGMRKILDECLAQLRVFFKECWRCNVTGMPWNDYGMQENNFVRCLKGRWKKGAERFQNPDEWDITFMVAAVKKLPVRMWNNFNREVNNLRILRNRNSHKYGLSTKKYAEYEEMFFQILLTFGSETKAINDLLSNAWDEIYLMFCLQYMKNKTYPLWVWPQNRSFYFDQFGFLFNICSAEIFRNAECIIFAETHCGRLRDRYVKSICKITALVNDSNNKKTWVFIGAAFLPDKKQSTYAALFKDILKKLNGSMNENKLMIFGTVTNGINAATTVFKDFQPNIKFCYYRYTKKIMDFIHRLNLIVDENFGSELAILMGSSFLPLEQHELVIQRFKRLMYNANLQFDQLDQLKHFMKLLDGFAKTNYFLESWPIASLECEYSFPENCLPSFAEIFGVFRADMGIDFYDFLSNRQTWLPTFYGAEFAISSAAKLFYQQHIMFIEQQRYLNGTCNNYTAIFEYCFKQYYNSSPLHFHTCPKLRP